jgi:hypothetical protein
MLLQMWFPGRTRQRAFLDSARARVAPRAASPAHGREGLARLGLLTVDARAEGDELSRLALRSVGDRERVETGPFARDVWNVLDLP